MRWCHARATGRTVAVVAAGVAALAQEGARAPRVPDEQGFVYLYAGAAIRLVPSELLAASHARNEMERGTAATPPPGMVVDPRSSRSELAERGLTLFRVAPIATPKGLEAPRQRPPWLAVLDAGLPGQPVFEQGAVLKIPTDQVIVAFDRELSPDEAKVALRDATETLKWDSIVPLRARTWLATLKNATGGGAFEASRVLSASPHVLYAEPNFIDIFLDTPPAPPELPAAPLKPNLGAVASLETPPGVKIVASWDRPRLDSAWQVQLEGDFESDCSGWMAGREAFAARTAPVVTAYRAHGGRRSAYMTGIELAGRLPPGPYPDRVNSFLFSPTFNLSVANDAFVELWFWARFEDPLPSPGVIYDYGRVLLFDTAEQAFVLALPIAPSLDSGDMTRDPLADRGWRRLLFRVPVALRSNPLQLVVQFVSDGSGVAEGLYIDDIRVLTSRGKSDFVPSEDPLAPRQQLLASLGQIAGRPEATDPAVRAAAAWRAGPSYKDLRVALLDDGVERSHPDLVMAEWDGTEEALPRGEPLYPEERHGTACAGLLGAVANNSLGIAGVAPGAPLVPMRRGVDDASIAGAIDDAVRRRARVLVVPWGWNGAPSMTITRAIDDAMAAGTVVIAAAGDAGGRVPVTGRVDFPCILGAATPLVCAGASSPAGEPKGAASADGLYWWSSKTGDETPELLAPGAWLVSTDRRGAIGYNDGTDQIPPGWTTAFGGTGAAACVVGGVATLMLAQDPALSPAETNAILLRTSSEAVSMAGQGGGRRVVNAEAAVRAATESAARRKPPENAAEPPGEPARR